MGWMYWSEIMMGLSDNERSSTASARYYANKAYTILQDASSLALRGSIEVLDGNCELAIENSEQAVELDPSAELAMSQAGNSLMKCGKTKEGIDLIRRSMEILPTYNAEMALDLSFGLWILGENGEAEEIVEAVLRSNRYDGRALLQMAGTKSALGEENEATEYMNRFLALAPGATATEIGSRGNLKYYEDREVPKRYLGVLMRAGLPE